MTLRICALLAVASCAGCFTVSLEEFGGDNNIEASVTGFASSLPQSESNCELRGFFEYEAGEVEAFGSLGCDTGNPQASGDFTINGLAQEDRLNGGCAGIEPTTFGFRGFNCTFSDRFGVDFWTGSIEYIGWPF